MDEEPIKIDLCSTCRKEPDCLMERVFDQQTCSEYQELSMGELLERDRFVRALMVGSCPRCGGENTYDCENNPIFKDVTVGHCLDCETYWCLECGHLFYEVEIGSQCPHWAVCHECSREHGYLDRDEFIEKICPTCEHYDDGCELEDLSKCEKEDEVICPYEADVSECPRIEQLFEEQA